MRSRKSAPPSREPSHWLATARYVMLMHASVWPVQVYYEKRKRRQEEKAASTASASSGSKKERKGSINNGARIMPAAAHAACARNYTAARGTTHVAHMQPLRERSAQGAYRRM